MQAYLKYSNKNRLRPKDELIVLLFKFNNENADLRYPDEETNPYIKKIKEEKTVEEYRSTKNSDHYKSRNDWRREVTDEFYSY
jgi:hypothetical protein